VLGRRFPFDLQLVQILSESADLLLQLGLLRLVANHGSGRETAVQINQSAAGSPQLLAGPLESGKQPVTPRIEDWGAPRFLFQVAKCTPGGP
jgi:hypothetical protein